MNANGRRLRQIGEAWDLLCGSTGHLSVQAQEVGIDDLADGLASLPVNATDAQVWRQVDLAIVGALDAEVELTEEAS